MATRTPAEHPDNRAQEGYPLGLEIPYEALDAATAETVARRHGIWTRTKMRRFLEKLCQTSSVKDAARAVGMSRQSAYRLRARLSGQPFDIAWEAALEFGLQQLAHAALDRALHGVTEPVFHAGEQVGTRTRYDERLTVFLLANPARVGRHAIKREAMLDQWADLMTHIEEGPLTWEEVEKAMADDPDAAMAEVGQAKERMRAFIEQRSHHAATARAEDEARAAARAPMSANAQARAAWRV